MATVLDTDTLQALLSLLQSRICDEVPLENNSAYGKAGYGHSLDALDCHRPEAVRFENELRQTLLQLQLEQLVRGSLQNGALTETLSNACDRPRSGIRASSAPHHSNEHIRSSVSSLGAATAMAALDRSRSELTTALNGSNPMLAMEALLAEQNINSYANSCKVFPEQRKPQLDGKSYGIVSPRTPLSCCTSPLTSPSSPSARSSTAGTPMSLSDSMWTRADLPQAHFARTFNAARNDNSLFSTSHPLSQPGTPVGTHRPRSNFRPSTPQQVKLDAAAGTWSNLRPSSPQSTKSEPETARLGGTGVFLPAAGPKRPAIDPASLSSSASSATGVFIPMAARPPNGRTSPQQLSRLAAKSSGSTTSGHSRSSSVASTPRSVELSLPDEWDY